MDDPRANPIIARRLITISLILEACPAATIYCGAGELRDNADLVLTARNLRPSIGAHPDAWAEAVSSIGSWYAAALIFYVLQIHEDDQNTPRPRIRNPGGLYRDLVRRTKAGTFDLAGELRKLRLRHME